MTASKFSRRKAGLPHVIPGLNRHLRRPSQPAPYSETLEPNLSGQAESKRYGNNRKTKGKVLKGSPIERKFSLFFTVHPTPKFRVKYKWQTNWFSQTRIFQTKRKQFEDSRTENLLRWHWNSKFNSLVTAFLVCVSHAPFRSLFSRAGLIAIRNQDLTAIRNHWFDDD